MLLFVITLLSHMYVFVRTILYLSLAFIECFLPSFTYVALDTSFMFSMVIGSLPLPSTYVEVEVIGAVCVLYRLRRSVRILLVHKLTILHSIYLRILL